MFNSLNVLFKKTLSWRFAGSIPAAEHTKKPRRPLPELITMKTVSIAEKAGQLSYSHIVERREMSVMKTGNTRQENIRLTTETALILNQNISEWHVTGHRINTFKTETNLS